MGGISNPLDVMEQTTYLSFIRRRDNLHVLERRVISTNITIVSLPPKCPELNPVQNVWQPLRDNWLSNRVFSSYTAIVDRCLNASNQWPTSPGAS